MNDSLGQRFRSAREEKGLDIRTIAEKTRIPASTLASIEQDDFSSVPNGGYGRGIIRYFAKEVGLDESEALRLFERQSGREVSRTALSGLDSDSIGSEKRRPVLRLSLLLLFIVAAIFGGTLYYFKSEGRPTNESDILSASGPLPVITVPEAVQPASLDSIDLSLETVGKSVTFEVIEGSEQARVMTLPPEKIETISDRESVSLGFSGADWESLKLSVGGKSLRLPASIMKDINRNYVRITLRREDLPRIASEGNIEESRVDVKRLQSSPQPSPTLENRAPANVNGDKETQEPKEQTAPPAGDD
jgi:transcriptional regulator with XRE-family HTH domain